jgi:hypothetical protein
LNIIGEKISIVPNFKELVRQAAKQKGYTLTDLYPLIGYKSYSGFRSALEEETLKGPALEKLMQIIGPLDHPHGKAGKPQVEEFLLQIPDFESMPLEDRFPSAVREIQHLRQIIALKDEIISDLRKQLEMIYRKL